MTPIRGLSLAKTRITSDNRGSMLPLMATLLMVTMAGAALAVDITRAYSVKAELQAAADSAALAAALKLPDTDEARRMAILYAGKNLPDYPGALTADDFEFGQWNAAKHRLEIDENDASAVRLTVRLAASRGNGLSTLFAGLFGTSIMDIEASAVAGKQGVACLIALDPIRTGIELDGNAQLDLVGCGAQSNSRSYESLKAGGKVRMTTGGICVSGRASIGRNADVTPTPIEYCPQHQDPMAGFIAPRATGCTDNGVEYNDQDVTLTAGRIFCGGLKISGKSRVTLKPGLYIIDNGKLDVGDKAVLEGEGVTILLHGLNADFDIRGQASLHLSAPTSGSLRGLLIIQELGLLSEIGGDLIVGKENKWNSQAPSELTGVVYIPEAKFTSLIKADITGTDACFVLIANQIKLAGKANISIDLSGTSCRKTLPTAFSRSVALLA